MPSDLESMRDDWHHHWQTALEIWSKFTRLRPPTLCFDDKQAASEGLTSSFAMIRLTDQGIVVNLGMIRAQRLEAYATEILAHEIGHHVYCPSNLTDHARMIARMRWALPTKEQLASFIANLYSDLLINDHLQRSANLKIADVYRAIVQKTDNRMWTLYMRIYEILWRIEKGKLATGKIDDKLEGDAQLGARLIRSYAKDWLDGAGRFAALCLPYVLEDNGQEIQQLLKALRDTENSGVGGIPDGLTGIEEGEREGAMHPSLDPELTGIDEEVEADKASAPIEATSHGGSFGQGRQPFEYGEILKSLGLNLNEHEVAVRYYRERAAAHLVRFPARTIPESTDPLPEGLEPWDIAAPLDEVDWFESVMASPRVIPGLTTVQRTWGTTEGSQPQKQPLDLDLYVDCSGSMPNPQHSISYLTLAGAIISLSALRAGARVQATLWSGARQFETTKGFVRDERLVLQILTGYLGGGTAFPIHILRDTYQDRKPTDRPVHILVISDNGVTTMYQKDEKGNDGYVVAQTALANARGGGTMVLNLPPNWRLDKELVRTEQQGWQIHPIRSWEDLVEFAKAFSRMTYAE
ncbi:MAG: VWA domain-containing protein [Chloroflexi bacterium]|nr:VWA domain-containing protein [Chloroflexota bacterium]